MPGRDQTGPVGEGSRTGRRMGICGDSDVQEYSGTPLGRFGWGGRGRRRGFAGWGRPRYRRYYEARVLTPDEELDELKKESGFLKQQLEAINEWIGRIEKK